MNGDNTIWADGTSTLEPIVWDDYAKLSSPGLGVEGTNKTSFIGSGETQTFDLSDFGLTSFDPTTFDTLGVRATSVNGTGAIKWVDVAPEVDQGGEPSIIQVTNTPVSELLSDISGDGRFLSWSASNQNDLDVFWTDLNNPTVVKTFSGAADSDETQAHISGDGQLVTLTSIPVANQNQIILWEPPSDSSTIVPTTNGTANVSQISDDGNHVVFSAQTNTGSAIYDWNPSTPSDPAILVSDPTSTFAIKPAISGDGSVVVYEDRSFSPNPLESEVVVRDLTTGVAVIIKPNELGDTQTRDVQPSISADGNYVAFASSDTAQLNGDVFLFDRAANGGNGELTNISLSLPTNGEEFISRDAISGEGQFVVFMSTSGGQTDVFVWDRDTGDTANITAEIDGLARNASISEDGRYIAFEANPDGLQFDIYRAENPLHDDFIM